MSLIASDKYSVVVGLGLSGLSCVRFLKKAGVRFVLMDTRKQPPLLNTVAEEFPDLSVITGQLDSDLLAGAEDIIVSPGIDTDQSPFKELKDAGKSVIGDIELFARYVSPEAKVVAITGSNGKSTVTSLLGAMADQAGINVKVGGNIGVPALDLLITAPADLYVLELSSFQLDTTHSLKTDAATVLNLQADHMDRYGNMLNYHKSKQRVYRHCQHPVWNKQDMLTQPLMGAGVSATAFTLQQPDLKEFGVISDSEGTFLSKGNDRLIDTADMALKGRHNYANALAALALGDAVALPQQSMVETLKHFSGLAHRCEWIGNKKGVDYINDSKGTNVGATRAALEGLCGDQPDLILIAGGVGKGADFSELSTVIANTCHAVIVFGQDAEEIAKIVPEDISLSRASDLDTAIDIAEEKAKEGDSVLFSPACASFDMFANFEQRGDAFRLACQNRGIG